MFRWYNTISIWDPTLADMASDGKLLWLNTMYMAFRSSYRGLNQTIAPFRTSSCPDAFFNPNASPQILNHLVSVAIAIVKHFKVFGLQFVAHGAV